MSDSEFLPVWKKYPGVAETMVITLFAYLIAGINTVKVVPTPGSLST